MNSIVDISKVLFVSKFSLLSPKPLSSLDCSVLVSLHNGDLGSEGGRELLFQYRDHKYI